MTDTPSPSPAHWPAAWTAALSDAALRQASSAAVFQRGKAYARSCAVEVIAEDQLPEPALRAQVSGSGSGSGSEDYSTEVWIENDRIAGACDCPNAADGWFCKHQVALALVWRGRLADPEPGSGNTGSTPARRLAREDPQQALDDFLHGQSADVLADKLLQLADHDPHIRRQLQQWRKLSSTLHDPVRDLKPLIDELLSPGHEFIEWGESAGYVNQAEPVLTLLQQTCARDAAAAVDLSLHALRRSWAALAQADDSDGEIGGLCQAIGDELVNALQSAGPQPARFGDTYLQLQLDDPFGCFDIGAAEAAMGDAALARYRQALAQRWRAAKDAVLAARAEPAVKSGPHKLRIAAEEQRRKHEQGLQQLEYLYLAQLKAAGDIDAVIAVLREDLSNPRAHDRLLCFLEQHGRHREAAEQAERAYQLYPDDWQLQDGVLRHYERDGMPREALAVRRRQFEHKPSVASYQQVLKAGPAAGENTATLRFALLDHLQRQEAVPRRSIAQASTYAPDVTLRAAILGSEGNWTEACALVQPPAMCGEQVLTDIATHLPADQNPQAVALLLRVFAAVMPRSTSPYEEALALVRQIGERMDAHERSAWLAHLRLEYKTKRNFMRDLPVR